jgi:hypothetical protein
LEIVKERESLHLVEGHTLRVSRVAGSQLLLIERKDTVDTEVRQTGGWGYWTVLSEGILRGEQANR